MMFKHIMASVGILAVIKSLAIGLAIIVLVLGYLKMIEPNSPVEEMAENYIQKETGVQIKVNGQ